MYNVQKQKQKRAQFDVQCSKTDTIYIPIRDVSRAHLPRDIQHRIPHDGGTKDLGKLSNQMARQKPTVGATKDTESTFFFQKNRYAEIFTAA